MSRIVTFGEIMGRLAAPGFQRFQQAMPGSLNVSFAGAEASVAASVAYLGADASFVTALPQHAIADACLASLRSQNLDTSNIVRTEHGRLGLYFLETGANQRNGAVIYDREGSSVSVTPASAYDWDKIFSDCSCFMISGITPAISKNAAEVSFTAMREAHGRGIPIAFDMNYRSKLWTWNPALSSRELAREVIQQMLPLITIFIGGLWDASEVLGISDAKCEEQTAAHITSQFPNIRMVAMTRRTCISSSHNQFGGYLYDAQTARSYYSPERERLFSIPNIVDRIGTGDAFTGALLFALNTPELKDPGSALHFATAAGCLAHSVLGDFNCITRAEIEALMHGEHLGRVAR
jgi:2-dehydro-3-deoxygluconokinase